VWLVSIDFAKNQLVKVTLRVSGYRAKKLNSSAKDKNNLSLEIKEVILVASSLHGEIDSARVCRTD